MRRGSSFAEVLDATLRGYQPEIVARPAAPSFQPSVAVPPNPFLFTAGAWANAVRRPLHSADAARVAHSSAAPATMSSAAQAGASASREERVRAAAAVPQAGAQKAAPRKLTPMQQRSLDAFIDAGASLGPDFSADQVRSSYRRLARRYHPDRHPLAGDAEKAALSRRFAAITSAYETLLTVVAAC